jgi:hypothetical protein
MATAVAGTFEDRAAAYSAVELLLTAGVPVSDLSLIVRDTDEGAEPAVQEGPTAARVGMTTGGLLGALGGLLVGLGALTVPGVGPVLATGPLSVALGGAALGAAAGGLLGVLVDLGIPEEVATAYLAHLERGHVLLTVRGNSVPPAQLREILEQAGAENLYSRTAPADGVER